jgi:serine protease Do
LKKAEGALVDEPQSGSPAAKAGILAGDVITAVDGKDVKDSRDLARRIGAMAPGNSVKLAILRNGETRTVALTLGQLPDQRQANAGTDQGTRDPPRPHARSGKRCRRRGRSRRRSHGGRSRGTCGRTGIKTGDVILDIAGKAVSKPEDVRQALANSHKDGKRAVLMRVKSGDATRFVAVPLGNA